MPEPDLTTHPSRMPWLHPLPGTSSGKACAIVMAALLSGACASAGNKNVAEMTPARLEYRMSGKSMNKADIKDWLGNTQNEIRFASGAEVWIYSYRESTPSLLNFYRNASVLLGGQENDSKELVILFDREGTARKWRFNETQDQEPTGVLNRKMFPRSEPALSQDNPGDRTGAGSGERPR